MQITLDRPWLHARFDRPKRLVSWAPHRPGFVEADHVVWREVRDADLSADFDALGWFVGELQGQGADRAVGLLTSRDVGRHIFTKAHVDGMLAQVLATVGLTNAERIGHRLAAMPAPVGTINLLVELDVGLSDAALLEVMSMATQARTAAVIDHGPKLPTGQATGTGTDCIVVAAPKGDTVFAGLHTGLGEAVGRAVYDAVADGTIAWMKESQNG